MAISKDFFNWQMLCWGRKAAGKRKWMGMFNWMLLLRLVIMGDLRDTAFEVGGNWENGKKWLNGARWNIVLTNIFCIKFSVFLGWITEFSLRKEESKALDSLPSLLLPLDTSKTNVRIVRRFGTDQRRACNGTYWREQLTLWEKLLAA